jgi:hypothetical protein
MACGPADRPQRSPWPHATSSRSASSRVWQGSCCREWRVPGHIGAYRIGPPTRCRKRSHLHWKPGIDVFADVNGQKLELLSKPPDSEVDLRRLSRVRRPLSLALGSRPASPSAHAHHPISMLPFAVRPRKGATDFTGSSKDGVPPSSRARQPSPRRSRGP